jgi:hypothetical protein
VRISSLNSRRFGMLDTLWCKNHASRSFASQSYSLPFHAPPNCSLPPRRSDRSAFRTDALKLVPAGCLDLSVRFSAERAEAQIARIPRWLPDFNLYRLDWFNAVAAGVPLLFGVQKRPQPSDRSSLRFPAVGRQVDGDMVAYANPSSEPVLRLVAIGKNLSGFPQCFFWVRIGHCSDLW